MNILIMVLVPNPSDFRVWTRLVWRKIFCGMIMAPMTAIKERLLGKLGTKPSMMSGAEGELQKKLMLKQRAMRKTKMAMADSKTRWPRSWIDRMPITRVIETIRAKIKRGGYLS